MPSATRRHFLGATATSAAALGLSRTLKADDTLDTVRAEVAKRHDEGVAGLQAWVKQPSIAAENRRMTEGCEVMMTLARDAGLDTGEGPDAGKVGLGCELEFLFRKWATGFEYQHLQAAFGEFLRSEAARGARTNNYGVVEFLGHDFTEAMLQQG